VDPSLRKLFKSDMAEQGSKLMAMIGTTVGGLKTPEAILPAVQALGQRHAGYSVKPEHYETVGGALVWTLERGLGEAFTEEVKNPWIAAYTPLSSVMIEAAAKEAA
jgi:hemoglobin-like flavoprotein